MINSFDIANLITAAAASSFLGYVSYWALIVRRALGIRVYRKQALGIASIALILASTEIATTFDAYIFYKNATAAVGNGGFGLFFVFLLLLFYCVDSSVLTARRTDPLSRDTLHWSKLRLFLWIPTAIVAAIVIPIDIYSAVLSSNPIPAPASLFTLLFPAIFIPIVSAVILLPLVARRAGDFALRMQLKWFGVFAASYFVTNIVSNTLDPTIGLYVDHLGLIFSGYCLYRSVLSLVPTTPFPKINIETSALKR
jgi:hypothetical protein